jgi:tetratricopeptide (TPR) repeat protein
MRRLGYTSVLLGWALVLGCTPRYSHLPLAPPLEYSIGENQLRQGETEEAIRTFQAYLDSGRTTYRARALYQLARAQYLSERYPAALDSLAQLESEYPEMSTKQANALRGDIAYATGHRLDAVLLWEKAYIEGQAGEREALEPRIRAAVDGMTESEAIELANLVSAPVIYDMAIDRLPSAALPGEPAARAEVAGATDERAADAMAVEPNVGEIEPARRPPPAEEIPALDTTQPQDKVAAVDGDTPAGAALPAMPGDSGAVVPSGPQVACLLPLTGSNRAAGRVALDQLRRAFISSKTQLVVRDSGSDPDLAGRLTGQLAKDPTVLAMIGPLSAAEVTRATAVAKATGLPMLPLSDAAGLEDLPRQAQRAADSLLESIEVAGDTTRDRVRESLGEKSAPAAPAGAATAP